MAVVEPTSYPGGPVGMAAWLEWRDLWPCCRSVTKRFEIAAVAFAVLAALFAVLASRPSFYGFLTVVCAGLAFLCALAPLILAVNEIMTVYYVDQRWIACYRGGRRASVDLARVTSVSTSLPGHCQFRRRRRNGVSLPLSILLLDPVKETLGLAMHARSLSHVVKMSSAARQILGLPMAISPGPGLSPGIARPPLRAWDDVRQRPRRDWSRP